MPSLPEPLTGLPEVLDLGDEESAFLPETLGLEPPGHLLDELTFDLAGVPVAPFPHALYGPSHPKGPMKGPAVIAVKRAVSRWNPDLLPWTRFTGNYTRRLEHALQALQREHGIKPSGQYGRATHEALRHEWAQGKPGHAFDALACAILRDLAKPKDPPEARVRQQIAAYCEASILYRAGIHYRQRRAMVSLGVDPRSGFYGDCSEHATAAYYWARRATKLPVFDPNHRYFDAFGYTGTLYNNPRATGSFKVGDLGIYGRSASRTSHVVTCYEPGDASSSVWCSHGSEIGPLPVRLHYRGDLLRVVRPPLFLPT